MDSMKSEQLITATAISEKTPRTVVGIWLFIMTPTNEVFVVRNLKPKYVSQKIPGQLNAPVDSYETSDEGKFSPNTIRRTIEEEVGTLDYDPEKVKPLGLIKFENLGKKVVAAPYLILVKDKSALTFDPKDTAEVDSPQWIPLSEITSDKTVEVKGIKVPLYRSPMSEIAEMVRAHKANPNIFRIMHVQPTIPMDLMSQFEAKLGA